MTANPVSTFLSPPPPKHPQVRKIKLMRKKSEKLFRMEIRKIQTIRRGAVGSDKQGKEMLDDFNGQIAEPFFTFPSESTSRIRKKLQQTTAAQADMNPIISEAGIGGIWKSDQVARNDSSFPQFSDCVQMASTEYLMAERHVVTLLFSSVPTGQTRAHEQFAIVSVGDTAVQLLLPDRWMR